MPYIPSLKTDGKSQDRIILDEKIEAVAQTIAKNVTNNFSLLQRYESSFYEIAFNLSDLVDGEPITLSSAEAGLASAIFRLGVSYGYEGAYLGELNYSLTRIIQRVPQILTSTGKWQSELRYWVYAITVDALVKIARKEWGYGISGVFEDVKDEYKRRVNTAYEADCIVKSGDCYDTPFYTRLAEVVDQNGNHIGYQEVMLKRSEKTLKSDVFGKIVITI